MKPKYYLIPLAILLACILIFGFTFNWSSGNKKNIIWSDRSLNWEDFELVNSMEEDYVAMIFSYISCPNLITDEDSKVYAYMNPNLSERLEGEHDSYNVLVHEQYHFNITEYIARSLRKELVTAGLGGLSFETIKSLKEKYGKKLDSLQNVYDSITDHNADTKMQRTWELKIDDWLRQTAYYTNEDIYSYYAFTENRTEYYKHIYFTATHKVLTSYPVGEKDKDYGETYQVVYENFRKKTVKFYKDGKLTNGGQFETAITKITKTKEGDFEMQYYNPDETYNTNRECHHRKSFIDDDGNRTDRYYNEEGERVAKNSVFESRWAYHPKEDSYRISYIDKKGRSILNEEGIFEVKRTLDTLDRTVTIENYDRRHHLKNDDEFIARYEADYNDDHLRTHYRLYDESGRFCGTPK